MLAYSVWCARLCNNGPTKKRRKQKDHPTPGQHNKPKVGLSEPFNYFGFFFSIEEGSVKMTKEDREILELIIKADELNLPWLDLVLSSRGALAVTRTLNSFLVFDAYLLSDINPISTGFALLGSELKPWILWAHVPGEIPNRPYNDEFISLLKMIIPIAAKNVIFESDVQKVLEHWKNWTE